MIDYPDDSDIAIVGLAGRFPKAGNVEEFWQNLHDGVEAITFFTDEELQVAGLDRRLLRDPCYVKAASLLDDPYSFDASFFGFNPKEAEIMDPQHRILLETAWEAIESAGYDPMTYKGAIGVFAGATINTYLLLNIATNPEITNSLEDVQINIANGADFLTTRISYKLNLKGPSHVVQSACSTSLVAVHVACQSLLNDECDMALAGGVSVNEKLKRGYRYADGGMASPDGHCRAFDAKAQGTIFGSGVGIVVLKRIKDAFADKDTIHAIIKGSAINNDGSLKVGYTAPSVDGQARVITEALANAGVEPDSISYIEAHGTGTPLGDPIEVQALTKAFSASTSRKGFCAIGSVKSNLGHLDAAAGVTGLIKTVLALKNKMIPPTLHFQRPNPQIDFDNSPFQVNATLKEWKTNGGPRRAGVSAFGVGGANAHVVLEEAPAARKSGPSRPWQVLQLSAKTGGALEKATSNLRDYLTRNPDANLADVAYTLQVGRQSFSHRRALVCRDVEGAIRAIEGVDPDRVHDNYEKATNNPVALLFPGQGAQHINMGLDLYRNERDFREQVDKCCEILKPELATDLRDILYPKLNQEIDAIEQLNQTRLTQPALFVVEYALARVWMNWGVRPSAMLGHSIGEYVAACIAQVISLEDALGLVAARSKMMQELPAGAMLSVGIAEDEAKALLRDGLSLAAVNGPSQCVISGTIELIEELERRLAVDGLSSRRLKTSHAFHSAMMDKIIEPFTRLVRRIKLKPPQIPYISNVSGTWIKENEATDADYWAKHLRETVRFSDGAAELLRESNRILVEVGPGQTLGRIVRRRPDMNSQQAALSSLAPSSGVVSDLERALTTLGRMWLSGAEIEWEDFYAGQNRKRIALPTYPFERQRYWIEPASRGSAYSATNQIVVSTGDLDARINRWMKHDPVERTAQAKQTKASLSLHPRPKLPNPYVAPANELEQTVAGIWQNALGIEQVGAQDNFFDLGGDSLLAVQVISQLRKEFSAELPIISLYEGVTVRSLVELLARDDQEAEDGGKATPQGGDRGERITRRRQYQEKQRLRKTCAQS